MTLPRPSGWPLLRLLRSRSEPPLVRVGAVYALYTDLGCDGALCERLLNGFAAEWPRRRRTLLLSAGGSDVAERERATRELRTAIDSFGMTRLGAHLDVLERMLVPAHLDELGSSPASSTGVDPLSATAHVAAVRTEVEVMAAIVCETTLALREELRRLSTAAERTH